MTPREPSERALLTILDEASIFRGEVRRATTSNQIAQLRERIKAAVEALEQVQNAAADKDDELGRGKVCCRRCGKDIEPSQLGYCAACQTLLYFSTKAIEDGR